MKESFMTTEEAAKYLGISVIWFCNRIKKKYNLVPVDNVGKHKLVYDFEEIEHIKQQENPCNILKEYYGWTD